MNPALNELLKDEILDERGGRHAQQGFTYQNWWAALEAIEMISVSENYGIVAEFKEDIAILDDPVAPKDLTLIQVKKKSGNGSWTLSAMMTRNKKKNIAKASILGGLITKQSSFPGMSVRLKFGTNVSFKYKMLPENKEATLDTFNFAALDENTRKSILETLSVELGCNASDIDLELIDFAKSHLPLQEQRSYVAGKISELYEKEVLQKPVSRPNQAATMLASEFIEKSSNTEFALDSDSLRKRMVVRARVMEIIESYSKESLNIEQSLISLIERLEKEDYPFSKCDSIRHQHAAIICGVVNRKNQQVWELCSTMADIFSAQANKFAGPSLTDPLESLLDSFDERHKTLAFGVEPGLIRGLALLVIQNENRNNIYGFKIDSKSEVSK